MIRCKFKCFQITEQLNWHQGDAQKHPTMDNAKLQVVTGDSEENKQFFRSTPSGTIEVGTVTRGIFKVGKEYYVDFTEVE